jgi:ribosomal protein S21
MINAEVNKTGNETALSTIRKFSRRVQGTGLIRTVRGTRYYSRDASKIVKKKRALKLIKRREEYRELIKSGKVVEAPVRRGQMNRETYPKPQSDAPARNP